MSADIIVLSVCYSLALLWLLKISNLVHTLHFYMFIGASGKGLLNLHKFRPQSFYFNLYCTCILYKIKMKNLCLVFLLFSESLCI